MFLDRSRSTRTLIFYPTRMSLTPASPDLFFQNPTQDEREALEAYMYLTSRLYPCGECATEFQALLKQFPPQVRGVVLFAAGDVLTCRVSLNLRRPRACLRVYGTPSSCL